MYNTATVYEPYRISFGQRMVDWPLPASIYTLLFIKEKKLRLTYFLLIVEKQVKLISLPTGPV